ncbi:TPA: adhesin [Escherichia coli]|nr:adhesin [Escherichia coli]
MKEKKCMKTVKLSLLAVVVATAVSPSAFAGDTVEAATTELTVIQPGMSQSEIDQKIGRFLERTGNSVAAQNYLIAHDYQTTTPQENTAASPVQPTNTLNPITNQAQTDRDNGQDTAIQDAQHAANWASMKADDAQHAITVAQTDIDANKAAIADTRNDVSAVQSDVTNIKGDVAHAQSTADHANANANTALINGVKLSGAVTENKNNIEQNRSDIADQQQQLDETRKIVAATGDVQTAARYQSMIDARQTAAANAQQAQADTQQQQMDDQQKQIDATQKTVSALGDAQTNAHYQEMVNAGLRAQNDANARTAAEQKQKIDTLATNQATQQHINSVQYGEQIQRLAQDSTQTHEQIDSLTQDVTQTHQQLSNTQKRVADNSQQITTLNNHFSSLKNEVEDNRKEANAGTASAIAIASQPQVKAGDFMMMSAGAGTFNGESAVSVGTSFNAGTHTVIKAGVSADTQSDFGAGVGVGYSF